MSTNAPDFSRPNNGKSSPANTARGSLTLKKGLSLLELFDTAHPERSLAEIWRAARLPRATAFRLVKTLDELGYLSFDEETGKYHLGRQMLRGALVLRSSAEVARIAHPFLAALATETTETAVLAVWVDRVAVMIDRVLTPRAFKPGGETVGMLMPGLANVHNRIFAAYSPESTRQLLLSQPHEARTEKTVTDPELLANELKKIRREGLAYGAEEWNKGMCAVGAPVFDSLGEVRASIAIIARAERFGPDERRAYGAAVKTAAARLSAELGFEPGGPQTVLGS